MWESLAPYEHLLLAILCVVTLYLAYRKSQETLEHKDSMHNPLRHVNPTTGFNM